MLDGWTLSEWTLSLSAPDPKRLALSIAIVAIIFVFGMLTRTRE